MSRYNSTTLLSSKIYSQELLTHNKSILVGSIPRSATTQNPKEVSCNWTMSLPSALPNFNVVLNFWCRLLLLFMLWSLKKKKKHVNTYEIVMLHKNSPQPEMPIEMQDRKNNLFYHTFFIYQ